MLIFTTKCTFFGKYCGNAVKGEIIDFISDICAVHHIISDCNGENC